MIHLGGGTPFDISRRTDAACNVAMPIATKKTNVTKTRRYPMSQMSRAQGGTRTGLTITVTDQRC